MSSGSALEAAGLPRFVVIAVGDRRLAVAVESVVRVLPAVEITPLGDAPAAVGGCVNVHGVWLAVIWLRKFLGLPVRELELTDHFVLVECGPRRCLLVCDGVVGIIDSSNVSIAIRPVAGDDTWCRAHLDLPEGSVSVIDPGCLLSTEDSRRVGDLLAAMSGA